MELVSEDASSSLAERVLTLPASLDLTGAEALRDALRAGLQEGALRLDGAAVERVSTPCLQVLAAAVASARGAGIDFRLASASPVLRAAIADLDLCAAIPEEL